MAVAGRGIGSFFERDLQGGGLSFRANYRLGRRGGSVNYGEVKKCIAGGLSGSL